MNFYLLDPLETCNEYFYKNLCCSSSINDSQKSHIIISQGNSSFSQIVFQNKIYLPVLFNNGKWVVHREILIGKNKKSKLKIYKFEQVDLPVYLRLEKKSKNFTFRKKLNITVVREIIYAAGVFVLVLLSSRTRPVYGVPLHVSPVAAVAARNEGPVVETRANRALSSLHSNRLVKSAPASRSTSPGPTYSTIQKGLRTSSSQRDISAENWRGTGFSVFSSELEFENEDLVGMNVLFTPRSYHPKTVLFQSKDPNSRNVDISRAKPLVPLGKTAREISQRAKVQLEKITESEMVNFLVPVLLENNSQLGYLQAFDTASVIVHEFTQLHNQTGQVSQSLFSEINVALDPFFSQKVQFFNLGFSLTPTGCLINETQFQFNLCNFVQEGFHSENEYLRVDNTLKQARASCQDNANLLNQLYEVFTSPSKRNIYAAKLITQLERLNHQRQSQITIARNYLEQVFVEEAGRDPTKIPEFKFVGTLNFQKVEETSTCFEIYSIFTKVPDNLNYLYIGKAKNGARSRVSGEHKPRMMSGGEQLNEKVWLKSLSKKTNLPVKDLVEKFTTSGVLFRGIPGLFTSSAEQALVEHSFINRAAENPLALNWGGEYPDSSWGLVLTNVQTNSDYQVKPDILKIFHVKSKDGIQKCLNEEYHEIFSGKLFGQALLLKHEPEEIHAELLEDYKNSLNLFDTNIRRSSSSTF